MLQGHQRHSNASSRYSNVIPGEPWSKDPYNTAIVLSLYIGSPRFHLCPVFKLTSAS